jgi:hypothetical protein
MPPNEQTLMDLGKLALKLAGNPKTRGAFVKAVKEVEPNYRPPADVQFSDFKDELRKEAAEREKKEKDDARKATTAAQRQTLLDSGRYTEDQVAEIEAGVMKKYKLDDYDAAAKLYAADMKPSQPSNHDKMRHGQIWEFPDIPGLLNNPDKAASDMAYSVIDELRASRS